MNTLPVYGKGDKARFDFRVPDGMGRWVLPDWDDPGLKVEFHDADDELRFIAAVASDPPLVAGDDHHESLNPQGGPFVAVEGLDLADYALGVVEARVYARVSGIEVHPWPSILAAFEVIAGVAAGPLYCGVEAVKLEAPGSWPEAVSEEMIVRAVAEASREVDAALMTSYHTPFADCREEPPTPPLISMIARKLAAYQCMVWMGRVNATIEENLRVRPRGELARLVSFEGRAPLDRLSGWRGPVEVYRGDLARSDDRAEEEVML